MTKIIQLKNGKKIAVFPTVAAAAKHIYANSGATFDTVRVSIRRASKGIQKSAYGYEWQEEKKITKKACLEHAEKTFEQKRKRKACVQHAHRTYVNKAVDDKLERIIEQQKPRTIQQALIRSQLLQKEGSSLHQSIIKVAQEKLKANSVMAYYVNTQLVGLSVSYNKNHLGLEDLAALRPVGKIVNITAAAIAGDRKYSAKVSSMNVTVIFHDYLDLYHSTTKKSDVDSELLDLSF